MPCVDPSSMRSGNAADSIARVSFLGVIECDLARCQAEAIAGGARRRLDPTPRRMVPVQHVVQGPGPRPRRKARDEVMRSEEHTSELQSPCNLVCRLLLEKKKTL